MRKLIFLAQIAAQTGCASIVASRHDTLRVVADPPNSTVSINGSSHGAAPQQLDIPRKGSSLVTVKAPGYESATCNTTMSAGGAYIAADIAMCVLLFPVGCISFIDASGAWNELEEPICSVDLRLKEKP